MSEHTGGGKFGKTYSSWPFVTLTIDGDGISMRTILQKVRMKREFIETIILQRNFINYRFIFKHHDLTIPEDIEFWTFSPSSVTNALRSQGYSVLERK